MIYCGIDPDTIKSGLALWDTETRKFLQMSAASFYDVLEILAALSDDDKVIIEAGWLNKVSNYHHVKEKNIAKAIAVGNRISKNVGANHQIGKLFEEYCKRMGISYTLYKPKRSKTLPMEFTKLTGLICKNQDMIDAAMLVYGL